MTRTSDGALGLLAGQGAAHAVAQGAARLSPDAADLLHGSQQLGVLNLPILGEQLARIAQRDPQRAADLLAEFKPMLDATEQKQLVQEIAGAFDARAARTPGPAAATPSKGELALDLTQIALSIAGIFDPTPISDGIDGVISLFRGDFLGAGISVVSMVPYVGDAAKLGKLGKFAETIAKAVDLAKADAAFAKRIAPALDKIRAAIGAAPIDKLPRPAREALQAIAGKLDEAADIGRTVAAKVGRNDVSWQLDAHGRTVGARAQLREVFSHAPRASSEKAAQRAAGAAGEAADVGGHIIGHRFVRNQGSRNIFPQNTQFNNSAYRKLENEWADWIGSGKQVDVEVALSGGSATRPDRVEVFYKVIDPASGKTILKNNADFANEAGQVFDRVPRSQMP